MNTNHLLEMWSHTIYACLSVPLTSFQSNLRRTHRCSADKTNSKLLGLHSFSMLTVKSRSCMAAAQGSVIAPVAVEVLRLFCYIISHEFLFNPHFDLEPDYIIRKGIRHRIQRYTVHTEILSTFHTQVECISQRHYALWNQYMPRCRKMPETMPETDSFPWSTWTSI